MEHETIEIGLEDLELVTGGVGGIDEGLNYDPLAYDFQAADVLDSTEMRKMNGMPYSLALQLALEDNANNPYSVLSDDDVTRIVTKVYM